MRNNTRLLSFMLGILAALFVGPGLASASLYSGGMPVPVGTEIVGNSPASEIKFLNGETFGMACTSSQFKGEVSTNPKITGGRVTVSSFTFAGLGSEGRCKSNYGDARVTATTPACINEAQEKPLWEARGAACSSPAKYFELSYQLGTSEPCKYGGYLWFDVTQIEPLRVSIKESTLTKQSGGLLCTTSLTVSRGDWLVQTASGGTLKYMY